MIRRLIILLLIVGCDSKPSLPKEPLSKEKLNIINKELDSWDDEGSDYDGDGVPDQGRWEYQNAKYNDTTRTLSIIIECREEQNEIAMQSFCDIAKGLAEKYASGYNHNIKMLQKNLVMDCQTGKIVINYDWHPDTLEKYKHLLSI